MKADSPEVRDGLMQIFAQARRGGEIIRRMRRFVSKHELDFSQADINSIVHEASGRVKIGEADGRIELSLELAEEPLTVLVDRIQIQQVVINLVQNGLDSMRETEDAGGRLRVRTARLGHDKVEVAVAPMGARDWLMRTLREYLSPFLLPNLAVWGLGFRSAGLLSRRTEATSGRGPTRIRD